MASFRQDSDIFSPVRFESLADSSNNSTEGSLASITSEVGYDLKNSKQNMVGSQALDLDSKRNDVFSPLSDNFTAEFSKKSSLPISPASSNLSNNLILSKKQPTDFKSTISNKKQSSKENTTHEEKAIAETNSKDSSNEFTKSDIDQQRDLKNKKPTRPTSLLVLGKNSNSCNFIEPKVENKAAKEASHQKRKKEKNSLKRSSKDKSSDSNENTETLERKGSFEQNNLEREAFRKAQLAKSKPSKQAEKKTTSNAALNLENQIVERMIQDCVSSETEKIRQILYSQQMSFYRQLNEIKANMERQHLATTDCLCTIIEELHHIHLTLIESNSKC